MVNKPIHDKSLDSLTEFKEGVEFLKNDYPQKALVKLQSAFESDKHNPFYISFLGVSIRVPSETGLKPRSFATWQYS